MPQPKPGEKPEGPRPKQGKKSLKPKPSMPLPDNLLPLDMFAPKAAMPDAVKKYFEEKHGYANYFFNKAEQQRVLTAWRLPGELKGRGGTWTIDGKLDHGGGIRIRLTDATVVLEAPVGDVKWTAGEQLADSLLPEHSGGMLPALYLWRRMILEGPGGFTEVYYEGAAPLPGHDGLADVLVGAYRGVEGRFYFEPRQGRLLAIEMFAKDDSDPCELRFSADRDILGRLLPGRMEVRFGDELFGAFVLEEFEFEEKGGIAN